jgi:hypothetical protein
LPWAQIQILLYLISNPALHAVEIMAFLLLLVVGFYLTVEHFLRGSCEPNRYGADRLPPVVRGGFADWMVRCERPFLLLLGALIALEVLIAVLALGVIVFFFALGPLDDPEIGLSGLLVYLGCGCGKNIDFLTIVVCCGFLNIPRAVQRSLLGGLGKGESYTPHWFNFQHAQTRL